MYVYQQTKKKKQFYFFLIKKKQSPMNVTTRNVTIIIGTFLLLAGLVVLIWYFTKQSTPPSQSPPGDCESHPGCRLVCDDDTGTAPNCAPFGKDMFDPQFYESDDIERRCCFGDSTYVDGQLKCLDDPNTTPSPACAPFREDMHDPRFYSSPDDVRKCCFGNPTNVNGQLRCLDDPGTGTGTVTGTGTGTETETGTGTGTGTGTLPNCAPQDEDMYDPRFYSSPDEVRKCCFGNPTNVNGQLRCLDDPGTGTGTGTETGTGTTTDAFLVIRHAEKDDSRHCNEECQRHIIKQLDCLGHPERLHFTNLTEEGIQQSKRFVTSIPRIIKELNLSPIKKHYIQGAADHNSNTYLTQSPYACSTPDIQRVFFDKVPTLQKPAPGTSVLISGNADDLRGCCNGNRPDPPFTKGTILNQLYRLYNLNEIWQIGRGTEIFVFRPNKKLKVMQNQ
jgi:hypothetical protein